MKCARCEDENEAGARFCEERASPRARACASCADLVRLKVDVIVASRPAGCLGALIAESAAHGLRFVRRLAEEWASGVNRFDRPGEALFVAEIDGRIVECGTCTS